MIFFTLVKKNNKNFITSNITQWMGQKYYRDIYTKELTSNLDTNYDFNEIDYENTSNYNTFYKIEKLLNNLTTKTNQAINNNSNIIFSYNAFFDALKHNRYLDNDALIQNLLKTYVAIWNQWITSLNSNNWLILATTDHGRNKDSFDYSASDLTNRKSWTWSNHDLNKILGHTYENFYDIRTVIIKFLATT